MGLRYNHCSSCGKTWESKLGNTCPKCGGAPKDDAIHINIIAPIIWVVKACMWTVRKLLKLAAVIFTKLWRLAVVILTNKWVWTIFSAGMSLVVYKMLKYIYEKK